MATQLPQDLLHHLEVDVRYLEQQMPRFIGATQRYLSDQDDPTGMQVSNLRLMVQGLSAVLAAMDGILSGVEKIQAKEHEPKMEKSSGIPSIRQILDDIAQQRNDAEEEK